MNADPGIAGLGSILASLTCILLILAVAAFALRRLRGRAGWQRKFLGTDIMIISSRQIGWQSSLLIVEAEGRRFLIGAGRNGLTAIGALDGEIAPRQAEEVKKALLF
jgi:flagellar biogenesis protein FliO